MKFDKYLIDPKIEPIEDHRLASFEIKGRLYSGCKMGDKVKILVDGPTHGVETWVNINEVDGYQYWYDKRGNLIDNGFSEAIDKALWKMYENT